MGGKAGKTAMQCSEADGRWYGAIFAAEVVPGDLLTWLLYDLRGLPRNETTVRPHRQLHQRILLVANDTLTVSQLV